MAIPAHVLANGTNDLPVPNNWYQSTHTSTGVYQIIYLQGFGSTNFEPDEEGYSVQKTHEIETGFIVEVKNEAGVPSDMGFEFIINPPRK